MTKHDVRFAEPCPPNPLNFVDSEADIFRVNNLKPRSLECEQELFLGFFFDGTNNNKYRDTPVDAQSNAARLFAAFTGTPEKIKATYGGETDKPFNPLNLPAKEFACYRKVYVPGLGTAFPEIGDSGRGLDKTLGLGMAARGAERIFWALLQFANQLNAVFEGKPLLSPTEVTALIAKMAAAQTSKDSNLLGLGFSPLAPLVDVKKKLEAALRPWLANKPKTTRIRISIFGFSRGAAEARTFTNWLLDGYGDAIGSVPIQIDMLGIFDTVASVGVAHVAQVTSGHASWADGEHMTVPAAVRRCVHLVAAHEVRMCFPLDSVCQNKRLPPNCKEVVYPGVHSDIGGGYPPNDQGRCPTDADKISQITLAQMYREARMAGVPLCPEKSMPLAVFKQFQVSDSLRKAFNDYIAATRVGQVVPTKGKGALGWLFPEETQPPESIHAIMRRHYAHYLSWRKHRINDVYKLPGLLASKEPSARQDIHDLWRTNEHLKQEVAYGRAMFGKGPVPKASALSVVSGQESLRLYAPAALKYMALKEVIPHWEKTQLNPGKDAALIKLFDLYVHDSRAWFKFGGSPDDEWFGGGKDPDGKPWPSKKSVAEREQSAEFAKRERDINASIANLEKRLANVRASLASGATKSPLLRTALGPGAVDPTAAMRAEEQRLERSLKNERAQLTELQAERAHVAEWGVLNGGRSPWYEEWYVAGYLNWRAVYTTESSRKRTQQQFDLFQMRLLQDQINHSRKRESEEKIKALQARQREWVMGFIRSSQETRRQLQQVGKDVRAYDESLSRIYKMVLDPMVREEAALRAEVEKAQRALEEGFAM